MVQWVNALATTPNDPGSVMGPTWQKARTNSDPLYSDTSKLEGESPYEQDKEKSLCGAWWHVTSPSPREAEAGE